MRREKSVYQDIKKLMAYMDFATKLKIVQEEKKKEKKDKDSKK